ncbi:hypothetical protein GUY60_06565 [Streptomyces sp. YC537]|uniref:Integral membrane protein n=1 Tax=Streptomyces boluensis TaxID=1775135 RepID=A0A964UKW4_9ACTN|nr:hypothetical protein [Streptomyces boluensis]
MRGYPAWVSSAEQTQNSEGPRPGRLTAAAALAALEGLVLVAVGGYLAVQGLVGDAGDMRSAVTGGLTMIALALLPLIAARGLFKLRSWSRGPAVITQIMALPVAWQLLQTNSVAIPGGIALAVVAVTSLVLLVNPETTKALGIGPRDAA